MAMEIVAPSRAYDGARLRAARERAGVEPAMLALLTGRTIWTVHGYETGRIEPPASMLARLSAALGCPIDEFFSESADG